MPNDKISRFDAIARLAEVHRQELCQYSDEMLNEELQANDQQVVISDDPTS